MNIFERLDAAFNVINEVQQFVDEGQPKQIDMMDQSEKMYALRNSRGPCVGWDDYIQGKDYKPPMYYNSNTPYGPKDTGARGMDIRDSGKLEFDGENPFSRRHGGIRPWSPGEVLATMMYKSEDDDTTGILYKIARKGAVTRVAKATHGKYDENDVDNAVQQGAMAVLQELPNDKAKLGTRFTTFVGAAIQQGMRAGVPPGYQDEYRKARGLRRALEPKMKAALKNAKNGADLERSLDDINGIFKSLVDNPNPGPKNPYGVLPPQLLKIKDVLIRAITSGNTQQIQQSIEFMESEFDKIAEKEEIYTSPGMASQGAVGTKPREYGTMIEFNKTASFMRSQRAIAAMALRSKNPEKFIHLSETIWRRFTEFKRENTRGKKQKDERGRSRLTPTKYVPRTATYHSPFENKMEDMPNSPGFIGLIALKERLEEALASGDKQKIKDFISLSINEQEILKHKEGLKAKGIGGASMTVQDKNTGKEHERTNFAGSERDVDTLHSPEIREALGMAIALVSPWRNNASDRKAQATAATEMLNYVNENIDDYVSTRSSGDTTKPIQNLKDALQDLDKNLGEYEDEIRDVLHSVLGAIKIGGGFSEIKSEINLLLKTAKQDVSSKPSADTVNERQYRMLLRLYGIDNYPERGTPNDPEIDENGEPSKWAAAGYPQVAGVEMGKQANVNIWTDIFENPDGTQSVSNAFISRQKTEAVMKFQAAANKVKQELAESMGYDSVEYQIMTECCALLNRMILEDILPVGDII